MNELSLESSPYLLQHAQNPVHWKAWKDEVFELAQRVDKPIFLSIGYATCHWCHVMEHECFENDEIAEILNRNFISIKVDREERPDVDAVYMSVCQAMRGNGGWPLSVFLAPNKKPFYIGTYFPREDRPNMLGFRSILERIALAWETDRDKIIDSADNIISSMKESQTRHSRSDLPLDIHGQSAGMFSRQFDSEFGGFGTRPKFPSPHNYMYLLRLAVRSKNPTLAEMTNFSLQSMLHGGINDHIGGGFHRYSTDQQWLLPHFEKMLYDQAMMIFALTELYSYSQKSFSPISTEPDIRNEGSATELRKLTDTITSTITYLQRELSAPEGGFYCGEDADSEGEEGKFYTWALQEIDELFDELTRNKVISLFDFKKEGNFLDEATGESLGVNILRKIQPFTTEDEVFFQKIHNILFERQRTRIRPLKDDKILTDWSALTAASLALSGRILQNNSWIDRAENCYKFIINEMLTSEETLLHRWRNRQKGIEGFLDDYAFVAFSALELYAATFEAKYLIDAVRFTEKAIEYFWNSDSGSFSTVKVGSSEHVLDTSEAYDGAMPSGNSIMAYNLARLASLCERDDFREKSQAICESFSATIQRYPIGFSMLLTAHDFLINPTIEVHIAINETINFDDPVIQEVVEFFKKSWMPFGVVSCGNSQKIQDIIPRSQYQLSKTHDFSVYICQGNTCMEPLHTFDEVVAIVKQLF